MENIKKSLSNLGRFIVPALWINSILEEVIKEAKEEHVSVFKGNTNKEGFPFIAGSYKDKGFVILTIFDIDLVNWVKLKISTIEDTIECIQTDSENNYFWIEKDMEKRIEIVNTIMNNKTTKQKKELIL